jgi:YD repeat-containing protein
MKNLYLLVTLLFLSHSIYAQVSSLPSSSSFLSTKYSDASINETTGKVGTAIAACVYSVGKIEVPISLNYIGNGVKVSEIPSWVGTNWNLSAGGVVTRIVNSYPDEKASARIFADDLEALGTNLQPLDYIPLANDTRDFRVDIFSFSFPGYSGSFYLDKNFIPRLTHNDNELKIEFLGGFKSTNDNTIVITTPSGVSYFFGGVNASEQSSTLVKRPLKGYNWMNPDNHQITEIVSPLATTAFYLYKIKNNYNDEILIDYSDNGTKNFILFEQQEQPLVYKNVNEGCAKVNEFISLSRSVFHGSIHNSKKIAKIYSAASNIEVRFNSDNLLIPSDGVMPTPQYDDKILKSIQVFNKQLNQNIKNIELSYLLPLATNTIKNRFFLEKVSFNHSNNITDPKCEVYKMEYNNPENFPSRFTYDVDFLGYYNGTINTSFIAKNENILFDSVFTNLAVRESNIDFSTKGSLTKMFYPTGGYTFFEYEQPKVKTVINQYEELYTYRNKTGSIPVNKTSHSFNIGTDVFTNELTLTDEPVLVIAENQNLYVDVLISVGQNDTTHQGDSVIVQVYDITSATTQTQSIVLSYAKREYNENLIFNLTKDHSYIITLKQDPLNPLSTENSIDAYAICEFRGYKYFPALGLRLKRISDFSATNKIKTKRYYYKKAKDVYTLNDDSAIVTYDPKTEEKVELYQCQISTIPESFEVARLIANPFGHIFAQADNQVEYKTVTVSLGGDNFEEGGIEKEFRIEKKKEVTNIANLDNPFYNQEIINYGSCNLDNTDCLNGSLIKEKIIQKTTEGLFYKSEKEYNYQFAIDSYIKNVIVQRYGDGSIYNTPFLELNNPAIGTYNNTSYRYNLTTVNSKTYTQPIPVKSTETPVGVMLNSDLIEYANLRGLPRKTETKDSKGKTIISKFFYPTTADISLLSGLSTQDIANYNTLESQNMIATPIQVETYLRDQTGVETLLLKKRSLFKNYAGKILPYTEQMAKSNSQLYSNSFFSDYNANADLVEVTQQNQFKKAIIYGYNSKAIIAELVGIPYAAIPATTIANLKTLSEAVVDLATMNAFETQLNALRADFPSAQITTYVYNETGQLSAVTDPRGDKITSEYDACKNLRITKDKNGNVIEEYKYNILNN